MQTNSIFAGLDPENVSGPPADPKPTSVFWTRDDGQMCLQSFRPEADVFFQSHSYSEYTIVVCLEGQIEKTQFNQTQLIGRGGTLIGNHGVEHTSGYWGQNGKRCEALVLSVGRRMLDSLTKELRFPSVEGDTSPVFTGKLESPVVHECARVIAEELRGGLPGYKIIVETMATRLFVESLRAWPRVNVHEIAADFSPRLPRRDFVRAHEFMRLCRKENFRLRHLCQFLGSSEERFARLFLASTQHTPASFYNLMLLERARDFLRDPKLSIKEVGFQLGFKTSSHFIAAFRRGVDATPQEYRQSLSANESALQLG